MKLKKSTLEVFSSALAGTEGVLGLADARIRDRFAKELKEATDLFIAEREKIYLKFCLKNKKGAPDLLNGTQYQFKREVVDEMMPEIKLLDEEEVELSDQPKIKEYLDKTEYTPKIGEAEIIDEIISQFK